MSEAFLKRAVKKHFKALGYTVKMRQSRLGNAEIDGEALGVDGKRIAIEVKTSTDDIVHVLVNSQKPQLSALIKPSW
jgi:hypothetical protein